LGVIWRFWKSSGVFFFFLPDTLFYTLFDGFFFGIFTTCLASFFFVFWARFNKKWAYKKNSKREKDKPKIKV
jgi:hypothetical protein